MPLSIMQPADLEPSHRVRRRPRQSDRDWLLRCYVLRGADALAGSVITYAVPLLVLTLTHSVMWTGLAFLLEWMPRLSAVVLGGAMVERHSPQTAVLATSLARAAAALLTLAGMSLGLGVAAVLAFGIVAGMLAEGSFLAVESLGTEASRRAGTQVHRVQSRCTAIDRSAALLGPLLGGALLLAGPALLLTTVAVLSTVTITMALVMHTQRARMRLAAEARRERARDALASGVDTLVRTPALAWLIGTLAAANFVLGVLQVSTPITVAQDLHRSTAATGLVWSVAAGASLLAALAAKPAVDRFGLFPVIVTSTVVACTAAGAAAIAPTLTTYTAAVATVMAAEGAATVALRTARARLIPARRFSATLATCVLLVLVPLPLAGLLVFAVPAANVRALLFATAVATTVATALCLVGLHGHRHSYEHPGAESSAKADEELLAQAA
ncbi:MFS transporter [Kitasatospora sp. NPDC098652]|uniref:MFS transporter n=1 Tax=Kitasatospora sp. NPDC098652 TaxID=3364095 RepID=UPI003805D2AA